MVPHRLAKTPPLGAPTAWYQYRYGVMASRRELILEAEEIKLNWG